MFGRRAALLSIGGAAGQLTLEDEGLEIYRLQEAKDVAASGSLFDKDFIEAQMDTRTDILRSTQDSPSESNDAPSDDNSDADNSDDDGFDEFGDMDLDEPDPDEETDPEENKDSDKKKDDDEDPDKGDKDNPDDTNADDDDGGDDEVTKEAAMVRLSMESEIGAGSFLWNAAVGTVDIAKQLAVLGIQYAPAFGTAIYKGVTTGFRLLAKLYLVSSQKINKHLFEQGSSLKESRKLLEDAKALASQVSKSEKTKSNELGFYSNAKVSAALSLGESTDVTSNVIKHTVAYKAASQSLHVGLRKEIMLIEDLVNVKSRGGQHKEDDLFVSPVPKGFVPSRGTELGSVSEGMNIYRYSENFISDTVLVMRLPDPKVKETNQLVAAFARSKANLVLDSNSYTPMDKLNYMDLAGVVKLLTALEELQTTLEQQQSLFNEIVRDKNRLKNVFRDYFQKIATAKDKIGIGESAVDVVVSRTKFVDDTYLVAIMDSQVLSSRAIVLALQFVRENLKRLM